LAGLEIHDVVASPGDIARAVMFEDALAAFFEHGEIDAEARVGGLRAGYGLKEQVDGCALFEAGELCGDVREAASLRGNGELRDEAV